MSLSTKQLNATLLGHPKGLFVLFLTELWERFSYYGMRALLVLFLVDNVKGGFGWSEAAALQLYGTYLLMVYMLGVPGGVLADRYIGQKTAVVWGGILQCIGHFMLAIGIETIFIAGLGFIALGTGLIKPNISTMVGELYQQGDHRRDSGFSIFYVGINIGALLAPIVIGTIGEIYGWHYGFGLAGLGVLIGLLTFSLGKRHLGTAGQKPQCSNKLRTSQQSLLERGFTKKEYDRLLVLALCFIAVFAFFIAFDQAGGMMNLYTESYIDRHVFGWQIPTSIFQSVNPAFVILLGPIVPLVWARLARGPKPINAIFKMGVGNIIIGIGFLFMIGAALERHSSPVDKASLHWLINAYLFHTLGELCLTPIALSFITKVAPERMRSSMMGLFFATIGISGWVGSKLGAQTASLGDITVFKLIFIITVLLGIPFILFNRRLMTLTHGSAEEVESAGEG